MPNERIHPVSSRTSSAASSVTSAMMMKLWSDLIRRSGIKPEPAKPFGEQPIHKISQQTSEPDRERREQQTEHAPGPRV